jgi:flavin reductase (DIM6/NTAB) family NADH-FMN oxidoreductase RutF
MSKIDLPISEGLYPVPVVLVSCLGSKRRPNIITIAWCGVVCSKPPMISVSIRPSRYSHALIKEAGDFVVNVPGRDMIKKADLCGIVSGAAEDKFRLCSFTEEPSSTVSSPMIKECPVNIECLLKDTLRLGSHDMFLAEVKAIHADERVVKGNRLDMGKAAPFVYAHGEYWDLGEKIGFYGFSRP